MLRETMEGKAVLISTLGTEPQVLTLCLQELLARGKLGDQEGERLSQVEEMHKNVQRQGSRSHVSETAAHKGVR